MNLVLQTLDAAGESYRVHTHPAIRGEDDLLDSSVPGMGSVYCGGGTPETTVEVDAAALLRIASRPATADIIG